MKNRLLKTLLLLALAGLAACQSSGPNFSSMSEAELAAYNRTVGTWEQVICLRQPHVRSHIPRRRCATRLQWQQGQVGEVGRVGSAGSGSALITID